MVCKKILLTLIIFSGQSIGCTASIRNKKPKNAVSYATVLLINEKSEILLLRRQNSSFGNGLYSLPGGKVESGETALEAAKREALEEVGIVIDNLEFVHTLDRQGPETEFYIFTFKASTWQGTPSNCEPDKCDDIYWCPPNKLPNNLISAHRQAIELSLTGVPYSEHGWDGAI